MSEDKGYISRIEEAIEDIRNGKTVVVVDDESRENEGDMVMAAELVTPESINNMAKLGRGLICVSLEGLRIDDLQLNPMEGGVIQKRLNLPG